MPAADITQGKHLDAPLHLKELVPISQNKIVEFNGTATKFV